MTGRAGARVRAATTAPPAALVRLQEATVTGFPAAANDGFETPPMVTLEDRAAAVRQAIYTRNAGASDDSQRWYLVDVYPEFAVVRRGLAHLKVPYSITSAGVVELGEAEAVRVEFLPIRIQEACGTVALHESAAEPALRGLKWDVEIIAPGWSKRGVFYSDAVLKEAVPLFENASVYYIESTASGHKEDESLKTQGELAGWIDGVAQRADGVLVGTLNFLREGPAARARAHLVDTWDRKKRDFLGLSIDARGTVKEGRAAGRKGRLAESIRTVLSVDVVHRPAAGGRFVELRESVNHNQEGSNMKTREQRLLRFLEARRPGALTGIDRETVTAAELMGEMSEAEIVEALTESDSIHRRTDSLPNVEADNAAAVVFTRIVVREKLQESLLPKPVQARIRDDLDGQVLTEAQVEDYIEKERRYVAKLTPARPSGMGGTDITSVGAGPVEKWEAGLKRSFGLTIDDPELRRVAPLGIRAFYNEVTRGGDPTVSGSLQESVLQEMLQEGVTTATFPRVMANVLNQALRAAYGRVDYGEARIITSRDRADDFREYESTNIGGFPDLSDFNDETGNYAEIAEPDEEAQKFAVGTKGNILTISRRTIINDRIGAIKRMVEMLGEAGRRTHARFVWNRVLSNPVMADGVTLFHASRGNLFTAALSAAALEIVSRALYNMTAVGGHEVLANDVHLLAVPRALRSTARDINSLAPGAGSPNQWHEHFGEDHENIVTCPFMTDATDWLAAADPARMPLVEMRYLFGQEEPELFLADTPTQGEMFKGDRIQYKIRHEYGGIAPDPRAWALSLVA